MMGFLKLLLAEIEKKNSWGKNELKDMILRVVAAMDPPTTWVVMCADMNPKKPFEPEGQADGG